MEIQSCSTIIIKLLIKFLTTLVFLASVTHGCVIATLTLFGPDGGEASRVPTSVSLLSILFEATVP